MKTLAQIISKDKRICSVGSNESVRRALEIMAKEDVGALLVIDEGLLVGIFSERDYSRKVILQGKSSLETKVSEIMTTRVTCISKDKTVEEAMAVMDDKHFRHLPVLDENSDVIAMITVRDLIRETISEQAFMIKQLETYIQS